ncbi:MAG: hypothetical protein DRI44_01775 [Chlamydiae bacterium]|nr:MAG: hypothetical protein DRI44_01775 [Chlamydiota bacterium]
MKKVSQQHIYLIWILVTVFSASAAVLVRLCSIPAVSIGFWRAFGAAVILLPFWFRAWLKEGKPSIFNLGAVLAGVAFGLHFSTWCWAIQHTTLANAALFVALMPLIVPFIAHLLIKEKLNKQEFIGVVLSVMGAGWLLSRQFMNEPGEMGGSIVAFLSAVCCGVYFVIGRKYRGKQHVILFSGQVYIVAAIVQGAIAYIFFDGIFVGDTRSVLSLIGLIIFPTIGGHTLAIYLLRHAKTQMVSFSVPAQFVLVTIVAAVLFGEIPHVWFYPGAALIVAGTLIAIMNSNNEQEEKNIEQPE